MKTIRALTTILASVLLCVFTVSCTTEDDAEIPAPDLQADFSFEIVQDNPQLVSFTNKSENAEYFSWEFGDGTESSNQKHPTHSYESPGSYSVTLTSIMGTISQKRSQEITVFGIPTAAFSYEADQDNILNIHFENSSQHVTGYLWDFGDGSQGSTEESPSHTFEETGIYSVKLRTTGDGGTAETTIEVEVTDSESFYDKLYIVGDASPSGWNISSPEAFIQSDTDPSVFTYEGKLTPGNFKISTFTGDWCDGNWIHPSEADHSLTATELVIYPGCEGPDYKWLVSDETEGNYLITVNLYDQTMVFEAQ